MTKIKTINGLEYDGKDLKKQNLVVRYTEDKIGKTLSISNEKIMFIVPFEEIHKMIKEKENE